MDDCFYARIVASDRADGCRILYGASSVNLGDFEIIYEKHVDMPPFPKERPRLGKNGAYMRDEYHARKEELAWMLNPMPEIDAQNMYGLQVVAIRSVPKSAGKAVKQALPGNFCRPGPDGDNAIGAVADVMFLNDSQIAWWDAKKIWGETAGMIIRIYDLGPAEMPF